MNILFVFYTLPNLTKSSMYSDLVNEFRRMGHNVMPMAPIISDTSKSVISVENFIKVIRVKTFDIFSKNLFKKGLANLFLSYQFRKAYHRFWKNEKVDLVILATPSVMFADFISHIKNRNGSKVYLMQKDIFPQNAVDLGMMKVNSTIFKFFKKKEMKLLLTSDIVGCTSPGNVQYFLRNYAFLDKNKVCLLYNSSKLFIRDECVIELKSDKFRVVFGGNIGKPQQLENVLNLAKRSSCFDDVTFILIGMGTELEKLQNVAKQMGIKNIEFIGSLLRFDYFKLLSTCDLGLISLHKDFTVPNTPMKLNDYLNAGLPILASIDRSNDLGEILIRNKMGKYAYADSPEELFEQFKLFYNDRGICKALGKNGYDFCLNNLSVESSYKNIIMQLGRIN